MGSPASCNVANWRCEGGQGLAADAANGESAAFLLFGRRDHAGAGCGRPGGLGFLGLLLAHRGGEQSLAADAGDGVLVVVGVDHAFLRFAGLVEGLILDR